MKLHHILACTAAMGTAIAAMGAYPILLWDMEPISELTGGAKLTLHHPDFKEVVMVHDEPWEGNVCCYHTVIYDGTKYRMYYRGHGYQLPGYESPGVTCYAESDDGIHWVKPNLGICEYNGSKDNNIILMDDPNNNKGWGHNFAPCYDPRPECPPDQRFKALAGGPLWAFFSADGIHWNLAKDEPVITKGAFDSQNTIIYDPARHCYAAYSRYFSEKEGARAIQRNNSQDGINWDEPVPLDYGEGAPIIELYTNAIHPYVNNPNVLIGLPKRFFRERASKYDRSGAGGLPGVSDGGFMSSRDGVHFKRWDEAFVRPGIQHERWINRNNMSAQGVVLTKSDLDGTPPVLTIYSTEAYYDNQPNRLRRLTLRQDGFVSVQAPYTGGSVTLKPMEIVVDGAAGTEPKLEEGAIRIVEKDGKRVLEVNKPCAYTLPVPANLGGKVSFAITFENMPKGQMRRLFSSYAGGPNAAGQHKFILDMQPGSKTEDAALLRMWYDGMEIGLLPENCPDWETISLGKVAIVATYDNGVMKLYMNGKKVAEGGEAGHGDLETTIGPVRFGEDYPPAATTNEPFLGDVLEMAVVQRVLSDEDIAKAATDGLAAVLAEKEQGFHYDMAGTSAYKLVNRLDAEQGTLFLTSDSWGEVMLLLNASTSALGEIRCEIRDEQNNPIPGYTLADSRSIFGDELDLPVAWKNGAEIKQLVGRKVILHFELKDADIYSIRFGQVRSY